MTDPDLTPTIEHYARMGVAFSQRQRDDIARLVDEGDLVGAQRIILYEVRNQENQQDRDTPAWFTDEWARDQLRQAYLLALQSPDPSTQNGGIVFDRNGRRIGGGCNEFTRDMPVTPDLLERPKKYAYIEHAERNALYDVLRYSGKAPYAMVVAWAACTDCARAIVQSGVRQLVRHVLDGTDDHTWRDSIADGDIIMAAGGVNILTITGPLGGCAPVLRNGSYITP